MVGERRGCETPAPPSFSEMKMANDNFTAEELYDAAMRRAWIGLLILEGMALITLALGIYWVGRQG